MLREEDTASENGGDEGRECREVVPTLTLFLFEGRALSSGRAIYIPHTKITIFSNWGAFGMMAATADNSGDGDCDEDARQSAATRR